MEEHDSKPQNPIIANVLYKSKILESWGRGISTVSYTHLNIISVVFFGQKFDFAAGIGVTLIVAGVVVLNLFSAASAH